MNAETLSLRQFRTLLIAVAVIVAMSVAAPFLQPLALAILLSFILAPVVRFQEKYRVPKPVAVLTTLLLVLGIVGGLGYVAGRQLMSLAGELPKYESNILEKVKSLKPSGDSAFSRASEVAEHVQESLTPESEKATTVKVVEEKDPFGRLQAMLGPFQETVAFLGVVLLLLAFILLERDSISDRMVQLAGRGRISLTTKTLTQIGERVSSYLGTFTLANLAYGCVIALGLWAFGLPYALLWGALAALLRFVPYVGPAVAFAMPAIFSVAHFDGWTKPLLIIGFYGLAELVANSLEPYVYGKSTGVSALGLLVAAMFWTWLWGALGLLMSTPLTVCLLVLGKHVSGLGFLSTMLGDELEVPDDLRLYQKLLNRDPDGAVSMLDEALERRPVEAVFDEIIVPALARADHDRALGVLEQEDLMALANAIRQWLDDQVDSGNLPMKLAAPATGPMPEPPRATVVGVSTSGTADSLVLRMLNLLLLGNGVDVRVVESSGTPLQITEEVGALEPDLILMSHIPPTGWTQMRYLAKRLRSRLPETHLIVGYWDESADVMKLGEMLRPVGVYRVASSLESARELILQQVTGRSEPDPGTKLPASAPSPVTLQSA